MAYLEPPLFVRTVFNRLAMRFGISGSTAVAIAGRSTGEIRRVPVLPVDHDGHRYLVSTRGEAEWVRNLRAAGGRGELRPAKGDPEAFLATEVPVEQRSAIIDAYRAKAGKTVAAYWKKLPDPADHPTFRLQAA